MSEIDEITNAQDLISQMVREIVAELFVLPPQVFLSRPGVGSEERFGYEIGWVSLSRDDSTLFVRRVTLTGITDEVEQLAATLRRLVEAWIESRGRELVKGTLSWSSDVILSKDDLESFLLSFWLSKRVPHEAIALMNGVLLFRSDVQAVAALHEAIGNGRKMVEELIAEIGMERIYRVRRRRVASVVGVESPGGADSNG